VNAKGDDAMKDQFIPPTTKLAFWLVLVLTWIQLAAAPARAQTVFDAGKSTLARPRIMEEIYDSVTVRIPDSTPRVLRNAVDQGPMEGSTKLGPMFLILKSSPEQEQALQTLLNEQQDKRSPNYHRWLTPDEFGAAFGVEESDLQQISDWLTNHGFTVNNVARGRRSVTFSGTAAQVEEALHTEIHNYLVDGERHFANSTDISIPEALAPVLIGVSSLDDFKPRPPHSPVGVVTGGIDNTPVPPLTATGGSHYMSPGDFSIIYNTQPLLQNNLMVGE
jgi:subtilase family serine protease